MERSRQNQKSFYILLLALMSIVLLSFFSAFARFVLAKDYNFHVEVPCEPSENNCFTRDCDDYCPPNGLENYKVFVMPATLYAQCDNNACENICVDNNNLCSEIECSSDAGDTCSLVIE